MKSFVRREVGKRRKAGWDEEAGSRVAHVVNMMDSTSRNRGLNPMILYGGH